MVALLKDDSFVRQAKPLPCLAPRLRLVEADRTPLRLDLEATAEISHIDVFVSERRLAAELEFAGPEISDRLTPRPVVTPQLAVLTAVLVLALLTFVRMSQGAPPGSSWDSLAPAPAAAIAPGVGETVRIVDPGDTLWAIAEEIAPDADPRVVVNALAQRNGGSGLQVGQRLVIPLNLITS